jgi:hypothetical protein
MAHTIKFYPVANGDTSQIILAGGRRILMDFCHRQKAEDEDTTEIDLKMTWITKHVALIELSTAPSIFHP